jgi:HEAT repeat protein
MKWRTLALILLLVATFSAPLRAQEAFPPPPSPETVHHLDLLRNGTADEKLVAIEWLGERREPLAVGLLIQCLSSPEDEVHPEAAWALGRIGDRRAVVPLVNALEAEVIAVASKRQATRCRTRHAVVGALQKLTGLRFGHDLRRWTELRNRLTFTS